MIRLRYGNTNTYYTDGLLIDTDMPGTLPLFYKELKKNGLNVGNIRFVLATHWHPDHMGLIGELTALGVKLLLIDRQKAYVHFSDRIFARQKEFDFKPVREDDAVVISCEESRAFLQGIGINGEIVPTESHSPDGIALITDDGSCFAGDLEPMRYIEAYRKDSPLKTDWDKIVSFHPHTVYFGHCNEQKLN